MDYLVESECFAQTAAGALACRAFPLSERSSSLRITRITLAMVLLALSCCALSEAQERASEKLDCGTAITTDRTPVTYPYSESPEVTRPEETSVVPYLVVTTNADIQFAKPDPANCTPQAAPNTGTDAACGLADALAYSANSGGANISFSSAIFNAGNTTAENTISSPLPDGFGKPYPFVIPANTAISAPTSVIAGVTTNLITIAGQVQSITLNGSVIIQVNSGVSGSSITNLNLTGGDGAIYNNGDSILVNHCVISGNTSNGSGGGINNAGSMVLENSSIIGNQSTFYDSQYGNFDGGVGGGIFNSGTMTILSSTISGNSDTYSNAAGGGIYNSGVLTVINSTIAGNSSKGVDGSLAPPIGVVLTAMGGGIASTGSGAALTVINSTITGNTANVGKENGISAGPSTGGGGISGTATIGNSIVSGNTASEGANDIQGNSIDDGGNLVGLSGLELAPLANYGGFTQTMFPLPGSVAICGGTLANVTASGQTVDQRGTPRTTGYIDTGVLVTCVDSGAVQTHYGLTFTTQPPAVATIDKPLNPAPVVHLTESGGLATFSGGVVNLTDSAHALSGSTQATLAKGLATLNDAELVSNTAYDTITAVLGVGSTAENPALSVTANASVQVSVGPANAILVTPAPGSTLTGSAATFTWTAGSEVTQYDLHVGTTGAGSSNIFGGTVTGTSKSVTGIPTMGGTLYVRLYSYLAGAWQYVDYTFVEASPASATLLSPAPGSTLTGTSATFSWTTGTLVTQYNLHVGTTGAGSYNVFSGTVAGESKTVTGIPTAGATLYVRLSSLIAGVWQYEDYTYTEFTVPAPATMASPTPGSLLTDSSVTFSWTTGTLVTQYDLHVGTTGAGSSNIFGGTVSGQNKTVTGIPTTGETVYVRLYSFIDGAWQYLDYTYTEEIAAVMTSPKPGSTLSSGTVTFTWTKSNIPGTQYGILVGTEGQGSSNVYKSGALDGTTITVSVPTTGGQLWVGLAQGTTGPWMYTPYVYTEAGGSAAVVVSGDSPKTE